MNRTAARLACRESGARGEATFSSPCCSSNFPPHNSQSPRILHRSLRAAVVHAKRVPGWIAFCLFLLARWSSLAIPELPSGAAVAPGGVLQIPQSSPFLIPSDAPAVAAIRPALDTNTAALIRVSDIFTVAIQPDGRLLIGGDFSFLRPKNVESRKFGRLNIDGTGDTNMAVQFSSSISSIAIQSDSRILVGGYSSAVPGRPRSGLVRLEPGGAFDVEFRQDFPGFISGIHPLPDGKILVSGDRLVSSTTQRRYFLFRIQSDGTIDETFDSALDGFVRTFAVQPDGRILVAGDFANAGGQPRAGIARLEADGRLDPGFAPTADGSVWAFAVQPDNRILVGGRFSRFDGQVHPCLVRLLPNGVLDAEFEAQLDTHDFGFVESIALQTDGGICVSGRFKKKGGLPGQNLARLLPDGQADPEFNAGANEMAHTLALDRTGRLWVGGVVHQPGRSTMFEPRSPRGHRAGHRIPDSWGSLRDLASRRNEP